MTRALGNFEALLLGEGHCALLQDPMKVFQRLQGNDPATVRWFLSAPLGDIRERQTDAVRKTHAVLPVFLGGEPRKALSQCLLAFLSRRLTPRAVGPSIPQPFDYRTLHSFSNAALRDVRHATPRCATLHCARATTQD